MKIFAWSGATLIGSGFAIGHDPSFASVFGVFVVLLCGVVLGAYTETKLRVLR